ncbi:MAG TPA: DUF4235 domain-containing protein [Gemmatimonadaceae bacterium]|nr:DUF4235 domain-containing protein [Gemmatimonadaceae bacterium]
MNSRQRWALMVTVSSILAAQLVEQVMTTSWRVATLKDPPDDPNYEDAQWGKVLLWTAAARDSSNGATHLSEQKAQETGAVGRNRLRCASGSV